MPIDGDDPNHINWIYEKASERAGQFNIQGMTYRLVQVSIIFKILNSLDKIIYFLFIILGCCKKYYTGCGFYKCCDCSCMCD